MITVNSDGNPLSAAFLAAQTTTIRDPEAKVQITWTDPYVDLAVDVTTNSKGGTSWEDQCADLIKETPHKYAITDGIHPIDGTTWIAPGTQEEANANQFGWYSAAVADGDGDFSEPYPTLTVEYVARALFTLRVVGEPTIEEYPVDFDIEVYENGEEVTPSFVSNVTGNTLVEYIEDITAENLYNVTMVKLIIKKWSVGNTIAKIIETFEAITDVLNGDVIKSIRIIEEREIKDGSLPVGNISANSLDLELQNIKIMRGGSPVIDPFFPGNDNSYLKNFMLPNRRVTAFLGFRLPDGTAEYINSGTFWTKEWDIKDTSPTVSVSCLDRIGLLKKNIFNCPVVFVDENLKTIAEYVLQHAKDNIPMLDLVWDVSDDLEDFIIPLAWFDKKDYAATLRDITEAALGQAYMSKTDVLIIEGYTKNTDTATDLSITKKMYFDKSQPSNIDDISNYIEVKPQPVQPAAEESTVYESGEPIDIEASATISDIEIQYSELPVTDAEAEIVDTTGDITVNIVGTPEYYPWGVVLTVQNITASAGTFKIRVKGIVYIVVDVEPVIRQDDQSIFENGKFPYKFPVNHLVQSVEVATIIAESLLASYKQQRRDASIQWRGDLRLELGDQINAPEYQRGTINNTGEFKVVKNVIDYDGSLRFSTDGRKV